MRQYNLKHWILAAIVLIAPGFAEAAGLGRLTVLSPLGQPLNAEIELSADRAELASLSARIASREAYQGANLQFNSALTGARLSIERRPSGQHFVKVVTNQAINEPFVDLLVELTWENGKISREFTALLDPPGFGQQAAAIAPAPAPEARPAPAARAPAATATARPAAPASAISGKEYGPIKRGETLSKIAASVKPDGVSLEQMLVGLYRSNPDAFSKNMNRMKTGKILRIPDKEELTALTQRDAAKEVRLQAADWRAYVAKVADGAGAAPRERTTASGKITARVEEKGAGAAKDVVRLSKGEPPGAAGKGKPRSSAERVRALEEEAVAREKALKEANERVAQLEKSIQDMKKLAEIKSPGMAAAQQQAAAKPEAKPAAAKPEPAKPEPAKPEPAKPADAKPEPAKPEPPKPDTSKPDAPKPEAVATAKPDAAPPAKPDAVPSPKPDVAAPSDAKKDEPQAPADKPVAEVKKDDPPAKPKPKVVAPPPPPPEPDIMDTVMDNLPLAGGGLAALLGLGGLGYWLKRRRSQSADDAPARAAPKLAKTEPTTAAAAAPVAAAAAAVAAAAPAADEVDPLAEAEVYIAYGRDAQAEEILKEAMSKDGSRIEVPVKLAEIYAARKDKASFNGIAGEIHKLTGGAGENWVKVAGMGYALDPDNALYAAGKDAPTSAPLASDATGTDLDFNLDIASGEPTQTDIQLDAGVADPNLSTQVLDAGSTQAMQTQVMTQVVAPPAEEAAPLMPDFQLDLPSDKPAASPDIALDVPAAAAPAAESNTIDFNIELPSDSGTSTVVVPPAAAEAAPNAGLDFKLDMGDINLNLDDSPTAGKMAKKDDHWYDVQQKFDLAKAYQEMGDKDGAKEILAEVLKEGDDEQKGQAKKLLDTLG